MEKKLYYICEYCFTRYDNEKDAENCEKRHIDIEEIIGVEHFSKVEKYPNKIKVKMKDGALHIYKKVMPGDYDY